MRVVQAGPQHTFCGHLYMFSTATHKGAHLLAACQQLVDRPLVDGTLCSRTKLPAAADDGVHAQPSVRLRAEVPKVCRSAVRGEVQPVIATGEQLLHEQPHLASYEMTLSSPSLSICMLRDAIQLRNRM